MNKFAEDMTSYLGNFKVNDELLKYIQEEKKYREDMTRHLEKLGINDKLLKQVQVYSKLIPKIDTSFDKIKEDINIHPAFRIPNNPILDAQQEGNKIAQEGIRKIDNIVEPIKNIEKRVEDLEKRKPISTQKNIFIGIIILLSGAGILTLIQYIYKSWQIAQGLI